MKSKKIVFGLSIFTAAGIIIYWSLVFAGLFPVVELFPGYKNWFMSFPLADFWIAANSLLLAVSIKKNDAGRAAMYGFMTASGMIFLALYALLYGINTGLLFILTVDELIEIAIKVYCLSVGTYFIRFFSQERVRN